ncbi:helix-turn-helix transcriptional regulator [Nioella ostreopsis]|uniref:helix-turn-helix transcriptional regulator n=1 Tax=Nioella ostreopsis TaxID=2448479 RepID=UPI001F0C5781|nr:AlpA family phage regulatory protein [Nioella ostreopsis]
MNKINHLHSPDWQSIEPAGRMLRPAEVFSRVGLSRSQVYAMISEGRFPPFIKLSERASAMPEAWLDAFIASCTAAVFAKECSLDALEATNA